jgi:hypothetical protein
MPVETNGRRISREDLQAAFAKAIGADGEKPNRFSVPPVAVIAGAVVVGAIALAFWLGHRGGRRDSAVVEIRRL